MTKKTRASSYFMGAMLGRFKKAKVAPPGGCDFGVRPIDQHIKGFEALGAEISYEDGMVDGKAVIDSTLCTGCNVCTQLCKFGAMKEGN